jgi:hypothetical protein
MQPMSIVIRISGVLIPRADLDAALNLTLDRYETDRSGVANHAQINIEEEADYWAAASRTMLQLKDKLRALSSSGSIGAMSLDAGLLFHDDLMAGSILIPSRLAHLAEQTGIDIEISVYRSQSPDTTQG